VKKNNLILIGMPGSGKSTLGVLLAKYLCMDFIDMDLLIQKKYGQSLQDIIMQNGIDGFLSIENQIMKELVCDNTVISTGGSAVLSKDGMSHLSDMGITVYLEVSFSELEKRLQNLMSRGVVMKKGDTLFDVYQKRLPFYELYADVTIPCGSLSMQECVTAIKEAIKEAVKEL